MFSNVLNENPITWVQQTMSVFTFLESRLDTRADLADLLSGSSAWALALALELVSTDTWSAWSWWNFLKWEELRVTLQSPPSAVSMLWFLFVTVSGAGWYLLENFPRPWLPYQQSISNLHVRILDRSPAVSESLHLEFLACIMLRH